MIKKKVIMNHSIDDNQQMMKMSPKLISFYADFQSNHYYENFAKALIERCKKFGVDYDIVEYKSRGSYGENCLIKPEFILEKLLQYKRPIIWMDCDTDFKKPFDHFNEITEDIGMATHSGDMTGIKASPLYFNYSIGAFKIIREWVVHSRAAYNNNIMELDHDGLKDYVLRVLDHAYTKFLLNNECMDFVNGKYLSNVNSRVDGKIQVHQKVIRVHNSVREKYSSDVKRIHIYFNDLSIDAFKTAYSILGNLSNHTRFSMNFKKELEDQKNDEIFKILNIESGGWCFFTEDNFFTRDCSNNEIMIDIKGNPNFNKNWDLYILKLINNEVSPIDILELNGGNISIKIKDKVWNL